MIEKIYLDMDGVIANFTSRYTDLFGMSPKDARDRKEFNPHWKHFIMTEQFKTLDWWDGADRLLYFLSFTKVPIEILSSSGGERYHDLVEQQKIHWLKERNIIYKANIVSSRKKKALYATSKTILIDDTEDVIEMFNDAGGIGILHKDVDDTISKLGFYLAK